jgi:serine/threonine protein kinase
MDGSMTAPASDSGRPSSVNRKSSPEGGNDSSAPSSVRKNQEQVHDEPTTITRPQPQPQTDDTPTVISGNRPRTQGPDSQLVEKLSGRKLGHFELIESVGVGGMAAVIKARDLDLGRIVALKILPPDMAVDPENVTRFKQEARAAAKLDHENIARVYFCGEDQGLHFIAFEFVEGDTLRTSMERHGGILSVSESISYLTQVTAGLVHAASRGVVHRDIKPSNIIITPDGKAKIVDMGLARNLDPHSVNGGVTQSGVTLGTFDYISPEQAIEPRSADTRSDIYSLGCTFYHVLTGMVPVPEGTAAKKLHAHQHVAPVDPRVLNPTVPDELAAILGRMMAKDPSQRYQTPEHLLQHLLALADKLQVNTGSVKRDASPSTLAYQEHLLPKPPGLSPFWIGATLVALLVAVIAFSGGLSGPDRDPIDQPPLWVENEPSPSLKKKEPNLPTLPTPNEKNLTKNEIKVANNDSELVALLTQSNARIQLLPGATYDLTRIHGKEPLPEALFQGKELLLQGSDPRNPAIIKLNALSPDDGKTARPGSLTLRGSAENGSSSVTIQNVIFRIHREAGFEEGANSVGLSLRNLDRIEFDGCVFEPDRDLPEAESRFASVGFSNPASKGTIPELSVQNSYFSHGHVGIRTLGRTRLKLLECGIAPHAAFIELKSSPMGDPTERANSLVRLEHCSVFLHTGAVIEIAEKFPVTIQSGFNLFSMPDGVDEGQPVVVKQIGDRAAEFRFEARLEGRNTPNGYHHVLPYQDSQAFTLSECKTNKIPYSDPQARTLFEPWTTGRPLDFLLEDITQVPKAFSPNLDNRHLRVTDRRPLLGLNSFLGVKLFNPQELPKLKEEPKLADKQRAWDPNWPMNSPLPAGVHRSFAEAFANLQKGDTLLLRFNGIAKIDPVLFSKLDTDLTIKPDEGFKPILTLNESTEPVMFNLKSGKLTLEGVQFQLGARTRSLVLMPRGAECHLSNCVVTLEDDSLSSSVVTLTDGNAEMMMMPVPATETKQPTPKISFQNSFIRGKGRLLYVKASKSFDLDVKNSLLVLDGSLIEIDPSQADATVTSPAQIKLHQTTAYFSGHLLEMEANAKQTEVKGTGLVKVNCQVTNCILMPATSTQPMILLERIESENQMRELFAWEGAKNNLYGFAAKQELLRYQSENIEGTMPKKFDRDEWLMLTSESAKSFSPFKFTYQPPEVGKSFSRRGKNEFAIIPLDPLPKLEEGASYGAPLGNVPNAE